MLIENSHLTVVQPHHDVVAALNHCTAQTAVRSHELLIPLFERSLERPQTAVCWVARVRRRTLPLV
jgi:hypothetical protein